MSRPAAGRLLLCRALSKEAAAPPKDWSGNVIVDVCIVPMGVGLSTSKYVARCETIFDKYGLSRKLHGYGTNVEGQWDDVTSAIKECHEALHAMGAPRISSNMRFGTRVDKEQTIEDKLRSVEDKLDLE